MPGFHLEMAPSQIRPLPVAGGTVVTSTSSSPSILDEEIWTQIELVASNAYSLVMATALLN